MIKYSISSVVRRFGLITLADKISFYLGLIKTYKLRRQFSKENPDVVLPPAYYIYETFNLNYYSFYNKSIDTAKWLISHFEKFKKLENLSILDWGCGPGRVIRHMPLLLSGSCELYGSDYNKKYINWCKKNIPHIIFKTNNLQPPLSFEDNFFDIVYGISIFTHLSKEMHNAWFFELIRVTKPEGIIFLTLHGDLYRSKLTLSEKELFDKGNLVIKAKTKEGHRTFGAFHPTSFVKDLVGENQILEHIPGIIKDGKFQQDTWIIKKIR